MGSEHESCVGRVALFASLTPQQRAVVAGYARPTHLASGEQLYGPGESVSRLFVVHTGRVKVVRVAANGAEQLIRTVGPGEAVGEHAFVTGARPDHRVVAMDEVQLCVFDHRDLAALTAAYPSVVLAMLRAVTQRVDSLEHRLAAMSGSDVTGRLADYLLSLPIAADTLRAGDGRTRVRLPMAKTDLASYLGTTPESLSRALRRLTEQRVIAAGEGPVVVIDDAQALESLANPS